MKKISIIILSILAVLIIGAYVGIKVIGQNHETKLSGIAISDVDLSKIPDGTYAGACEAFPVIAEVSVTVKGHKITEIKLVKHINGRGSPAEIIPRRVIEAQSLEVDAIAGATSSSKVILKAIQNALDSAVN